MKELTVTLGIFAGSLLFFYSFYFVRIIRGNPESFEGELLQALANWVVQKGSKSQGQLWMMLLLSFCLELLYFVLVFAVIKNIALLIFTGVFVLVEIYHLTSFGVSLTRFFRGEIKLKHLFNWRIERVSALIFFTHSLLVLVSIVVY
ncbi:MAG TPA: hypothetical protein GXX58_05950 [Gelria sp.]|nr:hypothetical protein [Gelria sp.]